MELKDKVALVTGGGTGLGRAISLAFAREGVHVAVNYSRSRSEAEETAAEVRALGVKALAVQADVADEAAVKHMVERVTSELGGLDVLVNNAAVTVFVAHREVDGIGNNDWDRIMDVNVKGAWFCSRAALPHMLAAGAGRIINISSTSGQAPEGSSLPYCVSKAAVIHLGRCLARAFAADNILVNNVCPGLIMTRWTLGHGEERVKQFIESIPIGRVSALDDVADQVLVFARTDSATGQTTAVDGGETMF